METWEEDFFDVVAGKLMLPFAVGIPETSPWMGRAVVDIIRRDQGEKGVCL